MVGEGEGEAVGEGEDDDDGDYEENQKESFHPSFVASGGCRGRVLKEEPPRIRGWVEFFKNTNLWNFYF